MLFEHDENCTIGYSISLSYRDRGNLAILVGIDIVFHLHGLQDYNGLSFGYGVMPKSFAQSIVDTHTPDRLVFASDMPWHRPSWERRLIESLDISDSDKDKIYYKNAMTLLDIY